MPVSLARDRNRRSGSASCSPRPPSRGLGASPGTTTSHRFGDTWPTTRCGSGSTSHGVDLPGVPMRAKRWGTPGMQWYYDRWQRRALAGGDGDLDRRVGFDVVHHATFASYWARTGLAALDKPFVWGPVGGAVELPRGFWITMGARGAGRGGLAAGDTPAAGCPPGGTPDDAWATVVIAQNAETAARIGRARPGRSPSCPTRPGCRAVCSWGRPATVRGKRRGLRRTAGPMEGGPAGGRGDAFRHPPGGPASVLRRGPGRRQVRPPSPGTAASPIGSSCAARSRGSICSGPSPVPAPWCIPPCTRRRAWWWPRRWR